MTAYTWLGSTSNLWSVATNWGPNGVPSSTDTATLSALGVTYNVLSSSIANLDITGTARLGFNQNTTLTVTGTTYLSSKLNLLNTGVTLHTDYLNAISGSTITINTEAILLVTSRIISGTIGGAGGTIEVIGGTLKISTAIGISSGLTYKISAASSSLLEFDGTVDTRQYFLLRWCGRRALVQERQNR